MARKKEVIEKDDTVFYGSNNVFADIGLPHAEELLVKAKIASTIHDVITSRGMTQQMAAEVMGIDQPKVSKIVRGRLTEFSTEWLLARLLRMGLDVDIVIHTQSTHQSSPGAITVACV